MDDRQAEAIASFSAIASVDNHTADTFLTATNYNVDEAVELFFAHGMEGGASGPAKQSDAELAQLLANEDASSRARESAQPQDPDYVRAPIPAKLDRLYEDMPSYMYPQQNGQRPSRQEVNAFRDFEAEARRERGKGLRGSSSGGNGVHRESGLGAMFEPPVDIMFRGGFEEAQLQAQRQNFWLLVNLQSNQEFASHQLNRDTWSDGTVKAIIKGSFIFLQLDIGSEEGTKFQTYYKVFDLPAIVVVDPITGSAMKTLSSFVSAERLMEELVLYMDHSPEDPSAQKLNTAQHRRKVATPVVAAPKALSEEEELEQALALSMAASQQDSGDRAEATQQPTNPREGVTAPEPHAQGQEALRTPAVTAANAQKDPAVIQEEARASLPPASDAVGEAACRVRIRFPDGSNKTHTFSKSHTVGLLRTFCIATSLEAASGRAFNLLQSGRGPAVALTDEAQTLGDAGLANSLIAMSWSK